MPLVDFKSENALRESTHVQLKGYFLGKGTSLIKDYDLIFISCLDNNYNRPVPLYVPHVWFEDFRGDSMDPVDYVFTGYYYQLRFGFTMVAYAFRKADEYV